ncbi:uncharacterized protein LOC142361146 isoform X2 [Opisthocomus hoazin]|uniref:uncharacterized protein LOC142361146 isoform X2 n=1 Tax=Opisthocomus hoazin TaxID=30419 RepID=UPI003F535FE3
MVPRPHPEPTGDGVHGEEGFVPSYGPVRSVERGSALSECCWAQGSGEQQQPKRCPAPLQTCSKCACTTLKLLSQVYLSVLMFSLRKRSPFQDVPAHSLRLAAPVSATTATRFGAWEEKLKCELTCHAGHGRNCAESDGGLPGSQALWGAGCSVCVFQRWLPCAQEIICLSGHQCSCQGLAVPSLQSFQLFPLHAADTGTKQCLYRVLFSVEGITRCT